MAGNRSLVEAAKNKQDEFYTQITDIEKELRYYRHHFEGKVVFCNCDDPFESNFFKYFVLNFNRLKLKKLICTCYASSSVMGKQISLFDVLGGNEDNKDKPYKAIVTKVYDATGDGAIDMFDVAELFKTGENELTELNGDGDFRSDECIALLKESDIVVTNPPFSLFREYVAQLVKYEKSFIIIGNQNATHYKEIFPLLQNNKIWLGYNSVKEFMKPDGSIQSFGNVMWYTNLDIKKRHEEMILIKKYTPDEYPPFDNYDAIEVSQVKNIPCDYAGVMGVPDSFLLQYNPDQFELLGVSSAMMNENSLNLHKDYSKYLGYKQTGERNGRTGSTFGNAPVIEKDDGKSVYYEYEGRRVQAVYSRLFIRNKHPEGAR